MTKTTYPLLPMYVIIMHYHVPRIVSLVTASLSLLLYVNLGTALLRLANVVLLFVLGLGGLVASKTSESTADSARNTVGKARAKVR